MRKNGNAQFCRRPCFYCDSNANYFLYKTVCIFVSAGFSCTLNINMYMYSQLADIPSINWQTHLLES